MTMHVQHGYGQGDRIAALADPSVVHSVILSPTDQGPRKLLETSIDCQDRGLSVLLDPQSYIYAPDIGAVARNHEENDLEFIGMNWSQPPTSTMDMIARVGLLNDAIGGSIRIAPSPLQSSFADVWTPLSIQLARAGSDAWGREKTIATLAIEESAFSDRAQVDAWLDVATTLEVRGFYLLVQRSNTSYPPVPWAAETLANVMSAIYVLTELNDYEVHWGYSDLEGLLGLAAGATAIATGWSHGLRQFSTSKWVPRTGGRQPAMRYPMRSIMSVPAAEAEAAQMFQTVLQEDLFDPAEVRLRSAEGFDGMNLREYHVRYLTWLADMVAELHGRSTPNSLTQLHRMLDSAVSILERPEITRAVALPPSYAGRLRNQRSAIEAFRDREGV